MHVVKIQIHTYVRMWIVLKWLDVWGTHRQPRLVECVCEGGGGGEGSPD